MKRMLIPLIVFITISSLNAQYIKRIGFHTGMNISNYFGGDVTSMLVDGQRYITRYSNLPGFNGSIFAEIKITENLTFQPELSMTLNRYNLNNSLPGHLWYDPEIIVYYNLDWNVTEMYINIPLLLKVNVLQTGWYSLDIYPGMAIGWLAARGVEINYFLQQNVTENTNRREYLAIFGIGNNFRTPYGDLMLDFRYQHKMLNNNLSYDKVTILDIRYDVYSINIGYAYNFIQ